MQNKIVIRIFWTSLIILFLFTFYRFRIDEIGISTPAIAIQSSFLLNIIIILCSITVYFNKSIPRSSTMTFLLLYALFLLFYSENTTLGRFFDINTYTSLSVWIFSYAFFYSFFIIQNNVDIPKRDKVITAFTILFCTLFLLNYFTRLGTGKTWEFIESYYMLTMLPFIVLIKNINTKNILILTITICMILAAKRTGILVMSFFVIYNFINSYKRGSVETRKKLLFSILVILACSFLLISIVLKDEFIYIVNRLTAISEDGGSGRNDVYRLVYTSILDSFGSYEFYFGHGYNSVKTFVGYSAHNDFLEVFYDFGLLGFILYITFIASLLKKAHCRNIDKTCLFGLRLSICIFLILSFFSHMIMFSNSIICLCAFWGYFDAISYKTNKNTYE